jgi:hypothetical protein
MGAWLAEAGPTATAALDVDAVGRESARIEATAGGAKVEERAVSIGPVGLFGMMTSPAQPGVGETPTVLFFNAGVIDHIGPARLWVELGRQWAAAGIRSVRFDISGIGDSPVHDGERTQQVFTSRGKGDVAEVLRAVLPTDPSNAVLVGLCSGAYYGVESAIGDQVRGLCAINPILTFMTRQPDADAAETQDGQQVKGGMKGWVRSIPFYDRINKLVQRMPSSAWWIVNRLAVDTPPARRLAQVVDTGANVMVIAGTDEGRWLRGGEVRTLRQLERTGRFRMEVIPGLEHTLFERHTREIAAGMLSEHVIRNFGPSRPA